MIITNINNMKKTILSICLLVLLAACSSKSLTQQSSKYAIKLNDKTISVDSDKFKKFTDSESYAKNFIGLNKGKTLFGQMVTLYTIPMSEDRKSGKKLSKNEYLEIFVVGKNEVTIQIRVDKGEYWLLSRESFDITDTQLPKYDYKPFLAENSSDFSLYENYFRDEIDNTRALLNNEF